MVADTETRKYEETIKRLFHLLKTACQERDEARDKLQLLLRKFQQHMAAETSPSISHARNSALCTRESETLAHRSYDLSLASCQTRNEHSSIGVSNARIADSSHYTLPKQQSHQSRTGKLKADIGPSRDITVDSALVVIDKLVSGKPLPQKGRLLRSVTEVGPLLQTLLLPPLPQWQNPPSSSSCIPTKRTHDNFSTKIHDTANITTTGAIPTCLSLEFPGNSPARSQKSSSDSGSGLSVKKEKMLCVDAELGMMNKQILTGKKIKLV
ncbi:hypothetical protein L6164_009874 [Bauhinia variegata]|uniref:Uncharacterized protein n=1 Tax=Bauhinia variegata TaxID=167791 RepID=A0ACB9PML5_BAUVA|nr:hypothetical protein L6164_009874 [Bauhinia variegata]